jgi:hypothetical protein
MNSTGCVGVDTGVKRFGLLINPVPNVVLSPSAVDARMCDASVIDLTEYATGDLPGSTLQFSRDSSFIDTVHRDIITSYSIDLGNTSLEDLHFFVRAVMPSTGCSTFPDSIRSFTITVHPVPVSRTISSDLSNGCSYNTIRYSVDSQPGVMIYSWSATGTDGTRILGSGTSLQDSVLWGSSGSGEVQVIYALETSGRVCSRTAVLPVDILPSPSDVNLEIVTSGSPGYTVDYFWSPDNGADSVSVPMTDTPETFTVILPGTGVDYTYAISKVTDSNGCTFTPAP